MGNKVILKNTNGKVYRYRVSEILTITPYEMRVAEPVTVRDMVSIQTHISGAGGLFRFGSYGGLHLLLSYPRRQSMLLF